MLTTIKTELAYPEISYKLMGIIFNVHNELGPGLKEKVYENALELVFQKEEIPYKRQIHCPIYFNKEKVSSHFLDFLIEKKIILELKVGNRFNRTNIEQLSEYLKATNLKLGILVIFGSEKVQFKRIVNLK